MHFSDHGLFYLTAVVVLVVISICVFLANPLHERDAAQRGEIAKWETVDALILKSGLSEVNTSGEVSFSTRITASVRIKYVMDNQPVTTDYATTWTRRDTKDWDAELSAGRKIKIRVSPEDPTKISLLDLTGVP